MGRAAGIHLIISTQRPSIKIITGTIKANFTARLAFRVTSAIDSRTILDNSGSKSLNGHGDMLLSTGTEIIHLQGAFVGTTEVERISIDFDLNELDSMFEDAARLIVMHQQGSTSLTLRSFRI